MFLPFALMIGIVLRWRPRLPPYWMVGHGLHFLRISMAILWSCMPFKDIETNDEVDAYRVFGYPVATAHAPIKMLERTIPYPLSRPCNVSDIRCMLGEVI
jgi:hypothetical protein